MSLKKAGVAIVVCVSVGIIVLFRSATFNDGCPVVRQKDAVFPVPIYTEASFETGLSENSRVLMMTLRDSRNRMSKELNLQRKTIGQMECEKNHAKTNPNGGWCRVASKENGGEHKTDMTLVAALSQFLKGKKVGSFGDGPGAYKREILKTKLVPVYDAYDGAPYCEETSEGRVTFMDLTVPQYGIPMYDWVISLEVAEHIPAKSESIYIDNILRHSREGIILSWAVPKQNGLSHINNRPKEYVVDLMKRNGFLIDNELSEKFQKTAKLDWLKKNTHVFRRNDTTHIDQLSEWYT